MRPPRRRRTRWRVDSCKPACQQPNLSTVLPKATKIPLFLISCCIVAYPRFPSVTNLLNVVVRESAAILKLLASEDQALLVRGDALLVLDLGLDIVDRVRGLDLEGDGLTREGLHEARESTASVSNFVCARGSSEATFEISRGNSRRKNLHLHYKITGMLASLSSRNSIPLGRWGINLLLL